MKQGKRIASGALALLLVLTACVTTGVSAFAASDAQTAVVQQWVDEGLLTGDPDGDLRVDDVVTRAEFIHMMVSIGFTGSGSTVSYTDVETNAWYYEDIMSATAAGYVSGRADGSFGPRDTVTRQEAIAMVVRALGLTLDEEKGADENCSSWFAGEIGAAITAGLYGSGTDFTADLTRAEAVCLLDSVRDKVGTGSSTGSGLVGVSGTSTGLDTVTSGKTGSDKTISNKTTTISGTVGDVTISSKLGGTSYTLDDVIITGDLIIESSGTITLDDVTVYGTIIIEGSGTKVVLKSDADVGDVTFHDSGSISGSSYTDSLETVTIDTDSNTDSVTISVDADEVIIESRAYVHIKADIDTLTVESTAKNASIEIVKGASVDEVNLNAACTIYGRGDIDELNINASGCSISRTLDIDDTNKASGVKNTKYIWQYDDDDYDDDCDDTYTTKKTATAIDNGTITLKVGDTKTLSTSPYKSSVSRSVTFSSSNKSVATVTSSGTVKAVAAGTATIYAKDAKDGNTVEKWTIKVTAASSSSSSSSSSTTTVTTYSISSSTATSGGTISVASSASAGETVKITVTPDTGYEVSSVSVTAADGTSVSVSGSGTSYSFTMPEGKVTISATFAKVSYSVTAYASTGGSVSVSTKSATYGTTVTVTATAFNGYELESITVNGETISGTSFTMPAEDVTVYATFTEVETAQPEGEGPAEGAQSGEYQPEYTESGESGDAPTYDGDAPTYDGDPPEYNPDEE